MKTSVIKPAQATWYVVDADGKILGRLATKIATVLRGRHRPDYTPHWLSLDHVVVINAGKVKVTGKKLEQKQYFKHTGWLGHLRTKTLKDVMEKEPTKALEVAVQRMLPKNATRSKTMKKLHIFAGAEHPHEANKPVAFPL